MTKEEKAEIRRLLRRLQHEVLAESGKQTPNDECGKSFARLERTMKQILEDFERLPPN